MRIKLSHVLMAGITLIVLAVFFFYKKTSVAPEVPAAPIPGVHRKSTMPTLKGKPARIMKSVEKEAGESEEPNPEEIAKQLEWHMRSCSTISYDENGDELERQTDNGCDGVLDRYTIYETDESGSKIYYDDKTVTERSITAITMSTTKRVISWKRAAIRDVKISAHGRPKIFNDPLISGELFGLCFERISLYDMGSRFC